MIAITNSGKHIKQGEMLEWNILLPPKLPGLTSGAQFEAKELTTTEPDNDDYYFTIYTEGTQWMIKNRGGMSIRVKPEFKGT